MHKSKERANLFFPPTAAGYKAIVLTVDTPVLGNRINERRVPLVLPPNLRLANIEDPQKPPKERKPTLNRRLMDARTSAEAARITNEAGDSIHSASITWDKTISFLRKTTSMQIILKGIMTPEDALLAIQHGVDAIVVSNHGGRQLDSVPVTIEVLPGIAAAVASRIPVIFDGGIRRGGDIFKALALGAHLVLIGRPVLWGLAMDGQQGVEAVLSILERELSRTMALAGTPCIADIGKEALGVCLDNGAFGVARL